MNSRYLWCDYVDELFCRTLMVTNYMGHQSNVPQRCFWIKGLNWRGFVVSWSLSLLLCRPHARNSMGFNPEECGLALVWGIILYCLIVNPCSLEREWSNLHLPLNSDGGCVKMCADRRQRKQLFFLPISLCFLHIDQIIQVLFFIFDFNSRCKRLLQALTCWAKPETNYCARQPPNTCV